MATAVHIPVSEYLATSYEPDCDYVDGEVEERNVGEQYHAFVQTAIAVIFYANRKAWGFRSLTELRLQVSATRYRVPDVCVIPASEPIVPIPMKPPVVCIEVLSPEDRFQRVVKRVQDYRSMGVEHIWIIDPQTRECWTIDHASGGAIPMFEDAFTIPGTPVRVAIADIFEEIDSAPKS